MDCALWKVYESLPPLFLVAVRSHVWYFQYLTAGIRPWRVSLVFFLLIVIPLSSITAVEISTTDLVSRSTAHRSLHTWDNRPRRRRVTDPHVHDRPMERHCSASTVRIKWTAHLFRHLTGAIARRTSPLVPAHRFRNFRSAIATEIWEGHCIRVRDQGARRGLYYRIALRARRPAAGRPPTWSPAWSPSEYRILITSLYVMYVSMLFSRSDGICMWLCCRVTTARELIQD